MSDVATGTHLSIGEVLSLVQEEFPDVTISKIRFLESQGLIAPERTASGYRKFYEADIDRLRWILAQQRDHFLPLKVIKRMLDEGVDVADGDSAQPSLFSTSSDGGAGGDRTEPDPDGAEEGGGAVDVSRSADASGADAEDDATQADQPATHSPAHPAVASARRAAPRGGPGAAVDEVAADEAGARPARRGHSTPADVVAALQEDPRGRRRPTPPSRDAAAPDAAHAASPAAASVEPMTAEELCAAAGITAELLAGLEDFGLVAATTVAGVSSYDAEALAVATVARRYAELGVEPRHLRMYKVAAEREAGIIEQMVVPLLKQRNPEARERAAGRADELLQLGAQLHGALLRRKLGPVLGP